MGLETIAIGAAIAGTAITAVGALEQGAAQQKASNYQAQVAANNAVIAKANAESVKRTAADVQAQGAAKSNLEALRTREMLGKQKVAAAASGLDVNSGTAVDIRASTAGMGMLSDLNIRDETNRKAASLFQQAKGLEMGADQSTMESYAQMSAGQSARNASYLTATGTLLSGAASAGKMYSDFTKSGVPMTKIPSIRP